MSDPPTPPEKIRSLVGEIRTRLEAGEIAWAISRLRGLIREGLTGPDIYRLLALALLKDGHLDWAIEELGNARAQRTSAAIELAFGRFLNTERYKEAALNCFQFAIELEPDNEDALALICMHYA